MLNMVNMIGTSLRMLSGKRQTYLNNSIRRLPAHVVNSILVTQPVRSLHSVVHVPSPVVLSHVAQGGIDTTLSSDGVRSGREQLGDTGSLETALGYGSVLLSHRTRTAIQ